MLTFACIRDESQRIQLAFPDFVKPAIRKLSRSQDVETHRRCRAFHHLAVRAGQPKTEIPSSFITQRTLIVWPDAVSNPHRYTFYEKWNYGKRNERVKAIRLRAEKELGKEESAAFPTGAAESATRRSLSAPKPFLRTSEGNPLARIQFLKPPAGPLREYRFFQAVYPLRPIQSRPAFSLSRTPSYQKADAPNPTFGHPQNPC
jgi:hypothetical protein